MHPRRLERWLEMGKKYKPDDNAITEAATNNISKWVGVLPPIIEFTVKKKSRILIRVFLLIY